MTYRKRLGALLMTAALAVATTAQADGAITYIKAGRLVDVEAGIVRTDQAIIIKGERIEKIGRIVDIAPPEGATIVDLSGRTVLPGLIDAHTHITSVPQEQGYSTLGISRQRAPIHGVNNALATLMAGFTTIRDVGARDYSDLAVRDAISEGEIAGPRIVASGLALGMTGGHCDDNLLAPQYGHRDAGVADGPWEVRAKVRQNVKYGSDLIKFCATGGVMSKGTTVGATQYTSDEMRALVDEAHMHGRKVAAHAHGTDGIKAALKAGVDSVEHSSLIDDEGIQIARKSGASLVMDIYVDDYIIEHGAELGILPESVEKSKEIAKRFRENFRRAHNAGVNIVFGTDAGIFPHGMNAKQFSYMVRFGMTPMAAIQAATARAAKLLGVDAGVLAAGRYADIIAVKGDPLADVTQLEQVGFVMKGGKIYKNAE